VTACLIGFCLRVGYLCDLWGWGGGGASDRPNAWLFVGSGLDGLCGL
jgi:hypothetical protein